MWPQCGGLTCCICYNCQYIPAPCLGPVIMTNPGAKYLLCQTRWRAASTRPTTPARTAGSISRARVDSTSTSSGQTMADSPSQSATITGSQTGPSTAWRPGASGSSRTGETGSDSSESQNPDKMWGNLLCWLSFNCQLLLSCCWAWLKIHKIWMKSYNFI